MIANVELMDMGDNGWLIFRIYKSKALIYLIVKGACKVEFTCTVKVTCESYHCILQVVKLLAK